ncbi:MAG: choice-of-anchor L domain-containing protein [Thermoplasmata archaeon]|nr:choice-of-anchor L domain-containing protein [Thermoplasmata archaeon]
MKIYTKKHLGIILVAILVISSMVLIFPSEKVTAGSYNGEDLVHAILANQSWFVPSSSSYTDTDTGGHRQAVVLSSLGTMHPSDGSTFALLSTGIAGTPIVTSGATNPGSERGTWFAGGQYGSPNDEANLTFKLQVPPGMNYFDYRVQFFSAEYPEYQGTQYNDKFTVTVNSPSKGKTKYILDVNSGRFQLYANDIPGTGFDIFALNGNTSGVTWVGLTPHNPGADAGATVLGVNPAGKHPVSPGEQITVTFDIKDVADNQFDSAAYIDNVHFSAFAEAGITAEKTGFDLNGGQLESGDIIRYRIDIRNKGSANQNDNPGNEFEDYIPQNTTYVPGSIQAKHDDENYGNISYDGVNKITWNGEIPGGDFSFKIYFNVTINQNLPNGALISNRGTIYWDKNGDHVINHTNYFNLTVSAAPPPYVEENFSDDDAGCKATQSYEGRPWFETSQTSGRSNFEVAPSCYYRTDNSFKIKLRLNESPQYWNYTLTNLNGDMKAWEAWFACGNISEPANLLVNFKNRNGNDIAKLKFEYIPNGTTLPTDFVLTLSYWNENKWKQLGEYLFNDWYKIRIEKNGPASLNYSLYRTGVQVELVDFATGNQLIAPFENLAQVEWRSTQNPVVCPLFFWDEHKVELE